MSYDSRPDTREHIAQVRRLLNQVIDDLKRRAFDHDRSKLVEPERLVLDKYTPALRETTYGSDEYNFFLVEMQYGLEHHYKVNDHHPEHFERGVGDMNLIQIFEMLADWKAATLRHADGDLGLSIVHNQERFDMSDEMTELLHRTAEALGWL